MRRRTGMIGLGVALLLSAIAAAAAPGELAGNDACITCHEDAAASLVHHGTDGGNCESCHGPGQAHVDAGGDVALIRSPARLSAAEQSATCRSCHVGGNATHWDGSVHDRKDVSCVSCHAVHSTDGPKPGLLAQDGVMETCFQCHKIQRVQMMRSSHMPLRENKMTCVDCHNPHGSTAPASLTDLSINDNCYRCHAEKRGPTLFEHPPVRENCLNCHTPHGSMHERLLIAKQPRLCQNCHINSRHPSEPRTASSRFVFNKSCVNCHSEVHGTNHPSGVRMMR